MIEFAKPEKCEVARLLAGVVEARIARALDGLRLVVDGTVAADGEKTISVTELRGEIRDAFPGYEAFRDGVRVEFDDEARLLVTYDPCRFCTEFDPGAA